MRELNASSRGMTRERYEATSRFGPLEGLRALAAAAVVWHHAADAAAGYFTHGVGVTTFFVLSGFLITRMLLRERDRTGTIAIGRFYLRRVLRTFPLYYAVLLVYVVMVACLERGTRAGAMFWCCLPWYLTFTTNWFVEPNTTVRVIFYFAWSLALQQQFYLLWPLLLRRLRSPRAGQLIILALVSGNVCAALLGSWHIDWGWIFKPLTVLDTPILYGVLAALILHEPRTFRLARAVAGRLWSLPLAVAAVALPAALPGVPDDLFRLSVTYLVMACVLAPDLALRPLESRLVRHVGNMSYGIYLLHMLVLNAVRRALPNHSPLVWFAVGFPATVLLASASWRWFETPVLRLRDARATAPAELPPAPAL